MLDILHPGVLRSRCDEVPETSQLRHSGKPVEPSSSWVSSSHIGLPSSEILMTKRCSKCSRDLAFICFGMDRAGKDGLQGWCRECRSAYGRAHREKDRAWQTRYRKTRPEKLKLSRARYRKTPLGKANHARAMVNYRRAHPLRSIANSALSHAVGSGRVKRLPCEACGAILSEGHHPDYSKPLEVVWLCLACHRAEHRRLKAEGRIEL